MSTTFAIDVENLTKKYGDKTVVRNFSIQVAYGQIYGFLGPNGSGKTTTIRMLCGLLKPDSGKGTCLGFDLLQEFHQIKAESGYMTQRFSLYEDLSIVENLDFIARLYLVKNRTKVVNETLERLGLASRRQQLVGQLSGGWKQRLGLAACILHKPKLLLLDEPTAGVDPKARREFWDEIHQLANEGMTVLVSTHYMDEAERCHKIAYISYGDLLIKGTVQEVIATSGLTTWLATGEDTNLLAAALVGLPGIEQVAVFGKTLHISGANATLLQQTLAPFQRDRRIIWEKGTPNLEDVFVQMTGKTNGSR
ncbi:MAG: ABC transporter ATP-binding protein [Alphaproteobacteria bacterium]|jgi:ABC-2 type transport system ATP-binding protein|nr:ABC transporter ATP-binding protein [Alphaproteobacteria bacterium]